MSQADTKLIEVTYQNLTQTIDLSNINTIEDLKKEVYNSFYIDPNDEIQILIQNLNETTKFSSFEDIHCFVTNKLMVYNTNLANTVPKQDSLQEFMIPDSNKATNAQKFIDEITQVNIGQYIQEDRNIQTDIIPTNHQSSNTFDFSNVESSNDLNNLISYAELELKNSISHMLNSDSETKNYLINNPDYKSKINELIKTKLNKFDNYVFTNKNEYLKEQVRLKTIENQKSYKEIIHEPSHIPDIYIPIYEEKCHLCLRMPLVGSKYLCLFCDDYVLCQNCEANHNHPCIKVKNPCVSDMNTIIKLVNLSQMEIVPKSFLRKTKEYLFGSSSTFEAKIKLPNNVREFYVKPNSIFSLTFDVENISNNNLPMNTFIIHLNSRDLNLLITKVEGFFSANETVSSIIECLIPNKICTYNIRIAFFHHNVTIDCEPVDIKIHVGINEDDYLNDFFRNEENLQILAKDQKKLIFKVINDELSTKNATQIASILMKYNWNINLAIDELVKEDDLAKNDNLTEEFRKNY